MKNRKVIIYIAVSLDGYIAKENDDISFLSVVEAPPEDYGYADFYQSIDTVIMGRKTYDKVLGMMDGPFWHGSKKCYVISRSKTGTDGNVEFNSDLKQLVNNLKAEEGKDIFIDGGAEIVNQLLQQGLIDRYIISIIPYFTGGGVRLFNDGRPEQHLKLTRSTTFPSGLVQLWYEEKAQL